MATVTGAELAGDALRYVGSPYVFGGSPGTVKGRDAGADCSSFVNMVAGRDFGLAIPGVAAGGYSGSSHGPPVISWATWRGAVTLPKGQPPSIGDLCVWPGIGAGGHIGIALSSTEMVSALDPESGVAKTPIAGNGPAGVSVIYRRITGVVMSGGSVAGAVAAGQTPGGAGGALLVLAAGLAPLLLAGVVVVGALVGGVLVGVLVLAVVRGGSS